ncbi:hypothetical protein FKM82_020515 [Ascaphus truei]
MFVFINKALKKRAHKNYISLHALRQSALHFRALCLRLSGCQQQRALPGLHFPSCLSRDVTEARHPSNMAALMEEHDDAAVEEHGGDDAAVVEEDEVKKTFRDLAVTDVLCEACEQLGWKYPTKIQIEAIPMALQATPGRLIDHLENTKGFNLRALKYLVMDEADRILNMDFETEVDKILKVIPRDRKTFLFSATMTKKVQKLQRAALKDPVKCSVSSKYQTVEKLQQFYIFIPSKFKDSYLVYILNELAGNSFMIFCSTCNNTQRVALMLRNLGFTAIPLHGQMSQNKRLGSLNKFKAKSRSILLATDVASRGLDIPHVDVVMNFDIPTHSKDYIHRVGRTARAGRSGRSITFVTQYDVELFQRIEHLIGKKLPAFPTQEEEVMMLNERVSEAQRFARIELREHGDKKKRPREQPAEDTEGSSHMRKKVKGGKFKKKMIH